MDTYRPEKIGKMIAWAGDHFVYEYGADQVIKFSKLDRMMGQEKAGEKSVAEYELCRKYFGDFILETRIVSSPDGRRVAKLQQKISGRFLKKADLSDERVRAQWVELLRCYDQYVASGAPFLDLLGQMGVWRRCLSNIFVTPEHTLILFDATVFTPDDFPRWQWPVIYVLLIVARILQRRRVEEFRRCSLRGHSL